MELLKHTDRDALQTALIDAGATIKGSTVKCPWHDDRTPSASLWCDSEGHWRYTCHVCAWSGDVYDILARNAGKSISDYLCDLNAAETPAHRPHALPPPDPPQVFVSLPALQAAVKGLTDTYVYTNPETRQPDMVVLRCLRDGKKTFMQARPVDGGFVLKAPAHPWPIYNRARIAQSDRVVVCEGEKCVHSLAEMGIVSTTSPGGAGKAAHADWRPLSGKDVVLWPDNDATGEKHMAEVAQILQTLDPPARVSIAAPAVAREKGDVADLLADMADADYSEKREVVESFLDSAESVGPARELEALIEDTIAGKRAVVPFPFPALTQLTRALLPGTISLLCGDPGAKKSFLLTQCLIEMHAAGVKVAAFMLEHTRAYHLNRILAQRTGRGELFNPDWITASPECARAVFQEHRPFLDDIGRRIWTSDDHEAQASHGSLLGWAEQRAQTGCRVIAIDPVTAVTCDDKPWLADLKFTMELKRIARVYGASIVLVTHSRMGRKGLPTLQDLAGSAAYPRFSQTILWVESHAEPQILTVFKEHVGFGGARQRFTEDLPVRSTLRLIKTTNGAGGGMRLAYDFGPDLRFSELGIVTKGGHL